MKTILEAEGRSQFMTPTESTVKRALIKNLIDDGNGHRHPLYAKRLDKFYFTIVPITDDPNMTAAISFDEGKVYVGEGFIRDPRYFYQLNVILRHELAHNLMMHQIRMTNELDKKYNKNITQRLLKSRAIHNLWNIIMDFEISNTRYSDADKNIIRNLHLNGNIISALVTEDSRKDWKTLSLEEMYKKLSTEIDSVNKALLDQLHGYTPDIHTLTNIATDYLSGQIAHSFLYRDTTNASVITMPLSEFTTRSKWFKAHLNPETQNLITHIYKNYTGNKTEANKLIQEIAETKLEEPYRLDSLDLDTPEDKFWAINALKVIVGNFELGDNAAKKIKLVKANHSQEYIDAFNKAIRELDTDELAAGDLEDLQSIAKGTKSAAEVKASIDAKAKIYGV